MAASAMDKLFKLYVNDKAEEDRIKDLECKLQEIIFEDEKCLRKRLKEIADECTKA